MFWLAFLGCLVVLLVLFFGHSLERFEGSCDVLSVLALSSSDAQTLLSDVLPNRIESSLTSLTIHLFVSTFITTFGLLVFFVSTLNTNFEAMK